MTVCVLCKLHSGAEPLSVRALGVDKSERERERERETGSQRKRGRERGRGSGRGRVRERCRDREGGWKDHSCLQEYLGWATDWFEAADFQDVRFKKSSKLSSRVETNLNMVGVILAFPANTKAIKDVLHEKNLWEDSGPAGADNVQCSETSICEGSLQRTAGTYNSHCRLPSELRMGPQTFGFACESAEEVTSRSLSRALWCRSAPPIRSASR